LHDPSKRIPVHQKIRYPFKREKKFLIISRFGSFNTITGAVNYNISVDFITTGSITMA